MQSSVDRLVLWGFVISGIIAMIIVLSVVIIAIIQIWFGSGDTKIPDVLANWGGIIVGFYFGTFISLIKDYMRIAGSPRQSAKKSG
jgi:hypothetical protein